MFVIILPPHKTIYYFNSTIRIFEQCCLYADSIFTFQIQHTIQEGHDQATMPLHQTD